MRDFKMLLGGTFFFMAVSSSLSAAPKAKPKESEMDKQIRWTAQFRAEEAAEGKFTCGCFALDPVHMGQALYDFGNISFVVDGESREEIKHIKNHLCREKAEAAGWAHSFGLAATNCEFKARNLQKYIDEVRRELREKRKK